MGKDERVPEKCDFTKEDYLLFIYPDLGWNSRDETY